MNNKIIKLANELDCTGCSACADVCPVSCISMSDAGRLFSYPQIDPDKCIKCGKCMKVCPSINELIPINFKQRFYAAWNKNETERMNSTSGGVGYALGVSALKRGYSVCGVMFSSDFDVIHSVAYDNEELKHFCGSKYVQSNSSGIYKSILNHLQQGGKTFFIGTPCQVEGLKRYLPSQYLENVITCEIICHGVNSPRVWKDYRKDLESKYSSKLTQYNFRSKSQGWQKPSGTPNLRVYYSFSNRTSKDVPALNNQFHYWFAQHYILRPSCVHCHYRNELRRADLTIADFWGVQNVYPEVDTFSGVSAVIVSSEMGLDFLNEVEGVELKPVDEALAKSQLRGYVEKKDRSSQEQEIEKIKDFEKMYLSKGYSIMAKQYSHPTEVGLIIKKILSKLGVR